MAACAGVSAAPTSAPRRAALSIGADAPRARVVAFDVDGTLTTRDCVVPFLRTVAGGGLSLAAGIARRAGAVAVAGLLRDRDRMKVVSSAAVFAGRSVADVEVLGRSFALRVLGEWIRPDTLSALRAHHAAGAEIVLVSASYGLYLRPLADQLSVHHVIATELESDGPLFSGRLQGGNCRGEEKLRRLHAWLADRYGERGNVELWAYGDSPGDAAMLADADHPVWVTRSRVPLP